MMKALWRSVLGLALFASLAILGLPTNAQAQYFGRNKVQYDKFKFQVLKTEHFDIYYYPEEAEAARQAARMAERWHVRLSRVLQHELTGRQPVVLYASHPAFSQTNIVEGEIGEGTGGVTEGAQRRVVLPFGATLAETDHVLGHELTHAFQYDMLGPNAEGIPLWFIEGMAEYLSLGSHDPQTAMWLRDATIQNKLPTISQLDDPRFFPYRFGHAFWAYIGGRWGDETIANIMHAIAPIHGEVGVGRVDAIAAIEQATGRDRKTLSEEWQASIRETYAQSADAQPSGGVVIGEQSKDGPGLNVGPALSPDGTQVAFLSERGRLSVDLYLADAKTGKITGKVISTAVDPHFESLQFLASAGAWSPSGKQLAIATISNGRPVLAIVDAQKHHIDREIKYEELGEIFQPSWSPDGNSVVFSAQVGGVTDIFVQNLQAGGELKRLTNDVYGDLMPAWSPDGKRIAFVTDRFSANLGRLAFGDYKLGVLSLDGGAVQPLQTSTVTGDILNPQWSSDGNELFFLGNAGGRQNVYRLNLAGNSVSKLTDEVTGVAGITPLSSALSVGSSGARMAFSVFRDKGYEIHIIDTPTTSLPIETRAGRLTDQGVLPPGKTDPGIVTAMLNDVATGLPPADQKPEEEEYKPHLQLVGIGQQIGVSTMSQFGTYVQGGIAMEFSDLLGNHVLGTSLAVNGGTRDISGEVTYLNRTSRLNWGLFGAHVPLLSGAVQESLGVANGQPVIVQETLLSRQTYDQVGGMVAYPISRATRIEGSTSMSHIGFSNQLRTQAVNANTGQLVIDDTTDLGAQSSLNLADVGAALVRDTSAFGGTGPILGQRMRLEVAPTFGTLQMTNLTLDYRQYFMPVKPVTFAFRAMHVGRYGSGGEDDRLYPLFLGYSTLVRGYDVNSFQVGDCTPNATSTCPEFDRLVGSRLLVFNAEVRAPLVGLFKGRLDYGPVPIEVFAFGDSGVAWTRATRPSFTNGARDFVSSVGFGARVNVFGYAVAEFNMARPLDRTLPGWRFVFNLRPGF